jgi:hypothetical protein
MTVTAALHKENLSLFERSLLHYFVNCELFDLQDCPHRKEEIEEVLYLARIHRVVQFGGYQGEASGTKLTKACMLAGHNQRLEHGAELLRKQYFISQVLEAISSSNIKFLLIRGFDLAYRYYPVPELRPFSDTDLILSREDFSRAIGVLEQLGYTMKSRTVGQEESTYSRSLFDYLANLEDGVSLHNTKSKIELDIHPADSFLFSDWYERSTKSFFGSSLTYQSLDPQDLLRMLLFHGRKHRWSRLIWVADIYYILLAMSHDQVQEVWELSIEEDWEYTFLAGVSLAHILYAAQVPTAVGAALDSFCRNHSAITLSSILRLKRGKLSRNQWFFNLAFQIKLERSYIRKFGVMTKRLFMPTVRDLLYIPLPKSLYSLYYLVRPLRILLRILGLSGVGKLI